MSRRNARSRGRKLDKTFYGARAAAAGATVAAIPPAVSGAVGSVSGRPMAANSSEAFSPLPREGVSVPFGPGIPLIPDAINPLLGSGRSEPRRWEYPVSWNLPGVDQRLIPWGTLRAAGRVDIVRDCVNVIKNELSGLGWTIQISEDTISDVMEEGGLRRVEAQKVLREKLSGQISRVRSFWQRPDPHSGYDFNAWLWGALEEVLVLDGLALYPYDTYGGDTIGLRTIDTSTVKVLVDGLGLRPAPPAAAFQQILYGFPRGEYSAAAAADGSIDGGYSSDELLYVVREVQTASPYGFSPVERALSRINLWLKRLDWMTREFDSSSLPKALLELPADSSMAPAEVQRWKAAINSKLGGDLAERHRLQVGLPGAKLALFTDSEQLYKPEYDNFIVKLVCAAFGVMPTEIGFIEPGGLGGQSYHEGQENVTYRKMILPWARWLAGIFNDINRRYLKADPAVEFRFLGLDDEDQAAADAVIQARVAGGRMTVNEARDAHGLAAFNMPEADEPMVVYGRGVLFLRDLMEQQSEAAAALSAPEAGAPDGQALPGEESVGGSDHTGPAQAGRGKEPAGRAEAKPGGVGSNRSARDSAVTGGAGGSKQPVGAAKADAADELDAFARWAQRCARTGKPPPRPFTFTAVDGGMGRQLNALAADDAATQAAGLAKSAAAGLREGGGGRGRERGPRTAGLARLPGTHAPEPQTGTAHLPGCQPAY